MQTIKVDSIDETNEHFNELTLKVRVPKVATPWKSSKGKQGLSLLNMYGYEKVLTETGNYLPIKLNIGVPEKPTSQVANGVAYVF